MNKKETEKKKKKEALRCTIASFLIVSIFLNNSSYVSTDDESLIY